MSAADELLATWDALAAQGAVVRRVNLTRLERWEIGLLLVHELRRLRALDERVVPEPAPINSRRHRAHLTANAMTTVWRAA